jgi:predicted RecB family nuclease
MDGTSQISALIFSAFLKCPTKAHLLAIGEPATDAFFVDVQARISSLYKAVAKRQLQLQAGTKKVEPLDFGQLWCYLDDGTATRYVDCETVVYDLALPQDGNAGPRPRKPSPFRDLVPVLFSPWDKPDPSDSLLVCFGALALSQATGIMADTGALIYGDGYRHRTVRIADHVVRTRQTIDEIGAARSSREPEPLVLNRHCAVCDFQPRCRALAIQHDDLSLLTAMTGRERTKLNAKGICTITQMSYGYRPRRRKRTRPDAESSAKSAKLIAPVARNDHKLRALAVKKNQIHVIGVPVFKFESVPVFLDVEGMPDRDFYYLIGLRFECGGETVERSFWADGQDGELAIWQKCLETLKTIENVQIISYGAYEARFLKRMKERYTLAPADIEFVGRLIETSVNLVGCIYGKIYFPTFSNSLKEVGRYLGFEWTWPRASGAAAALLRRAWELDGDYKQKQELIRYNIDDCRAAATVADVLLRIRSGAADHDAVNVGSLEVSFHRTFGKFDSVLPEFAKINRAAYWDYQRSKVYVRTDKTIRRTIRKSQDRSKATRVEQEVTLENVPEECPKCHATRLWMYRGRRGSGTHVLYDLKFTRRGIKRWAVRYRYNMYVCSECRAQMTPYLRNSKYGPNLRAFVVYLLIELRLSNQKAAEHVSLMFDVSMPKEIAHEIKSDMAEKYWPTYRGILRQIAKGTLIHADETKGVVKGGGHYVWVFTNMTTVAYVYAESREANILNDVLDGFRGVLVSDFYAAYDSAPCAQQKCLIHLMRDINEDLRKNPFDDELKVIASRFGTLLREIVETIDTHGLKVRHLSKHRRSAEEFVEHVVAMKCTTEAGLSLKKRIEKNRNKLFTFLNYDGVPWNNNNAEHAVRAFTRLRNLINTSTPKGTREFATLLSIQQTLRYRGKSLLEFMRSGRMEIEG